MYWSNWYDLVKLIKELAKLIRIGQTNKLFIINNIWFGQTNKLFIINNIWFGQTNKLIGQTDTIWSN